MRIIRIFKLGKGDYFNISLYFIEVFLYSAGLAITTGFGAALADGHSIGMITPSKYKGFILFPIVPLLMRIIISLVVLNVRWLGRMFNIFTALALGTWIILLTLKLGIESSIPDKITWVQTFIPMWVFLSGAFFGSLSNMLQKNNTAPAYTV